MILYSYKFNREELEREIAHRISKFYFADSKTVVLNGFAIDEEKF